MIKLNLHEQYLQIKLLENWNKSSLGVLNIFINVEKEHEDSEESTGGEEVPEVVTVVEVEEHALVVSSPGRGRRSILVLRTMGEEVN